MAALTTAQEYSAIREAIQQPTTLDTNGNRRDAVSFVVDGMTVSYSVQTLPVLQAREKELARRLTIRNARKRVTPDFGGAGSTDYLTV
jgi:hypothetical protein